MRKTVGHTLMLSRTILAAALLLSCSAGTTGEGQETAGPPPAPTESHAAPVAEAADERPSPEPAAPVPVFHIQLWDAHKTGWRDEALDDLKEAGFTVVQNGWRGSLFPSRSLLDRITSHGLLYAAYLDTRYLFGRIALPEEKRAMRTPLDDAGAPIRDLHPFDPVYHAVVRRGVEDGMRGIEGTPGLFKVLLNSEHSAPLSYDDLTVAEAVKAGVMSPDEKIASYSRGVFAPRRSGDADGVADPVAFMRWFDAEGGDNAVNRVAIEVMKSFRPEVKVTTDGVSDGYTYGLYRGMEIMQAWVRVHRAPRDPLSVACGVETLKAHIRHEGKGEVWIGPQLGSGSGDGSVYAAPADMFEEALWLAAAFGARGITCWGYDTIRRDNPLDMDTWGRIRRFRDKLLSEYPWLPAAIDAPRVCAVLLSKANHVLSEKPYYEVPESYGHFCRVLVTAHIPTDVIYDDDVFEGALKKYKVLFLPSIVQLTDDLWVKIAAFEEAGGRVVRWPFLKVAYRDYEITKGSYREDYDPAAPNAPYLLPHQYRQWRHYEAAKLQKTVEDLMDVKVDNLDVIMNVVEHDGKRYVVLVNDKRTYGAWTEERGFRWSDDKGLPTTATVTVGSGEAARTFTVELAPAGIAVVPL